MHATGYLYRDTSNECLQRDIYKTIPATGSRATGNHMQQGTRATGTHATGTRATGPRATEPRATGTRATGHVQREHMERYTCNAYICNGNTSNWNNGPNRQLQAKLQTGAALIFSDWHKVSLVFIVEGHSFDTR